MTVQSWYKTRQLAPGLWQTTEPFINEFFAANAFTLTGRDADLQVDFGCGLAPLREHLPSTGKPIVAVATHSHIDHVGAFHEFETRLGHLAEADAFATMAEGLTFQDLFRANAFGPAFCRTTSARFSLEVWRLKPAPLTRMLIDGDRIDLGDRTFTVLHLPGHSPGSIGLLDEKDGLFSSVETLSTMIGLSMTFRGHPCQTICEPLSAFERSGFSHRLWWPRPGIQQSAIARDR